MPESRHGRDDVFVKTTRGMRGPGIDADICPFEKNTLDPIDAPWDIADTAARRLQVTVMPILRGYGANQGLTSEAVGPLLTRLVAVFDQLQKPVAVPAPVGATVPLKKARLPKVPKTVTADLEVDVAATAEEPPKRAKTLRLPSKSKQVAVETIDTAELPTAESQTRDVPAIDIPAIDIRAPAVVETPEPGPVLSPAERREAILRKLREEGDTTVPPRRESGDGAAPPAFRYPVNRFAR
jgi:hypothetical protein